MWRRWRCWSRASCLRPRIARLRKSISARSINSSLWAPDTLHVGDPPKTIIDDDEQHAVLLTIWDANAQTKVYWRAPDGKDARTTLIPGRGVQTFETLGVLKVEAVGEPYREVKYGYVLLGLRQ